MRRIAITGIGGFIGGRMAERARERGLEVVGLEVSEAAAARASSRGFVTVVGDVGDPGAVRACVSGADVVFHTAAIVEEDGELARYRRVNVEGTRTVAGVSRDAGAKMFVHLSSVMVYGFTYPPHVGEEGEKRGEGNAYCQTKIESEDVARSFHGERMGVLVIRPGDVYGAASVPWVLRPLELLRQRVFYLPDGGRGVLNHVHVDNLLDAVFLGLDRRAVGEVFTVTDGEDTSCERFFGYHARMLGRRSAPTMPASVLRTLIGGLEKGSEALGLAPPARRAAIEYLLRPHAYGIGKARRLLGYEPRIGLAAGMREVARELGLRDPTRADR